MHKQQWLIVYNPGEDADGQFLHINTRYIGPFPSHDEAYDHLCSLPAVGEHGIKFIAELQPD